MKMHRRMLVCVLLASLAGCVPWPHHYLTAPRINGTVVRAGQPAGGVHVQLADVLTDRGEIAGDARQQETVTDALGHFTLGPLRRFGWTAPVPVFSVDQHTTPWGLRLSADGRSWQPGWLSDPTLLGHVMNVPLVARCDLDIASRSSVIGGNESLVGNGSCTLTAPESKQ